MSQMSETEMPSAVLRSEHQVILRVLSVLERLVARSEAGDGFEKAAMGQCVEFFRFFADACHHAKEEDLLFPTLEARGIPREGGPIGCMLEEHRLARQHTKEMGEALEGLDRGDADAVERFHDAAHKYRELLEQHIYKEDNILFNMGDQVMSQSDQDTLGGKFCEVGCRSFGGKKREELERMADDLEARWSTH